MSELLAMARKIDALPPEERQALTDEVLSATSDMVWVPSHGPQMDAYHCEADELLYGGEAGGGKSDLICGLSVTDHRRSLILRRFTDDAKELAERTMTITNTREGYNGQDKIYRWKDKIIDFGGCKEETDKQRYKGKPHDLIGFDELSDFLESQYRFIIAWNRSVNPNQRCRVVGATNPPTTADGLWIIRYWAPWLDPTHPNPAEPGELRWFVSDEDGHDFEVGGPGEYDISGRMVKARSRTFIRSTLQDNPDLSQTDYGAILDALPKELRDAYRDGKFDVAMQDTPNQMIPTTWVMAARQRWVDFPPHNVPMCAVGVDVAQGGQDQSVFACRHDGWFAPLVTVAGKDTPDGPSVAGRIVQIRRHNAHVTIDMGGGYGGSAYDHLKDQIDSTELHAYKGAAEAYGRSADKMFLFANKRTEAYWRFREALDPGVYQGSPISLPPDTELVSDLTAPTYKVTKRGPDLLLTMEPKEQLVKRLGRSTDRGDAVVMSWYYGPRAATHITEWREDQRVGKMPGGRRRPKVNMGPRRGRGR